MADNRMSRPNDRSARARSRRLLCGASLAAVLACAPLSAQAEDRHWDANVTAVGSGGTGTWDLANLNWSPNGDGVSGPFVRPWENGTVDNAIFGGTAGTVTVAVPVTVGNITFNSAGYVLNGSTLTLDGPAPTITTNFGNANATINSTIAGSSGLVKAGVSGLILNGTNSFTGGITLNSGSLYAANDAALGALSNNIVTAAGVQVRLSIGGASTSRAVAIGDGGALILEGSGAGSALISGNGAVRVAASGVTMSNDLSSYTGQTIFTGCNGTCSARFTSLRNLGEASSLGAPVTVADGTIIFNQQSQYSDSLIYLGDGDSSNRNWDINGNNAIIRNQGTGALSITGDIDVSTGATFIADTANVELLGILSGGAFGFNGAAGNTVTLGGANTFTGQATISGLVKAAVLADTGVASSLGAGSTIGLGVGALSYVGTGSSSNRSWVVHGTSGIQNDGTGALDLSGDASFVAGGIADSLTLGGSFAGENRFSGVISGAGNLISNGSGTWVIGGANNFTGNVTVTSGTLKLGNAAAFGPANGLVVNGGTLDLGGYDLVAPSLTGTGGTVALGSANLTVDTTADIIFAGSIAGAGGFTKAGVGTLTLGGANSYTGATTVNGGLLVLDFNNVNAPTTDIISSASTLNMAGGRLTVFGGAGENNVQTFNGLNILAGNNRIGAQASSTGSVTINFGAINRSGGLVDFGLPLAGNFTTSNVSLGGWATVNGTDYAKVVGGNIVAFTDADYTDQDDASLWADGQYISDSDGDFDSYSGTVASDVQLAGLQFTTFDPTTTVTIDPAATLGIDGTIIVATSVGGNNQTITGGSLTGGSGGSTLGVQQNSAGTFIIESTIVDNGGATSFAKAGNGTVRLTGTNGYTGGTTLSGGRLEVTQLANGGTASSIGASSAGAANLVLESGTLAYTGGVDAVTDRGITLVNGGAERTIEIATGRTVEFSGLVTSPDDAGFTKAGAGMLTLANTANDYVGVTTVAGGTLAVNTLANGGIASGIGAAGNASENLVLTTGGQLRYTGGTVATDRGFTLAGGNGRIDVAQAATTLTISGVATGSGNNFIKDGAGTLVLSGTNTYTGDTIVTAGTLRAGSTRAFGFGGRYMTVNTGATLDLGGYDINVASVTGGGLIDLGGRTLTTAGGPGSFTGRITGTGGFTRGGGSYTQTISGCNNDYTGVTTISSGLAIDCIANGGQASAIGASSSASSNLVLAGGTLAYTGASASTDRGFAMTGNGAINVVDPGTVLEFSGDVTGGGQLAKTGAGTLLLSGTNSSTGNLRIINGTVRTGSTTALGTGPMTLDNTAGVLLDLDGYDNDVRYLIGGGALGGDITLGGATLTINAGGSGGAIYGGAISGSGGLVMNGASYQQLSGCASSYGGTTVINDGTLAVDCLGDGGANSSIGSSSSAASNLILNGGTLRYVGTGGSTNRQFTLGASAASRLESWGTGAIAFTHAGPLTFASANTAQTLTLGGANTANNIFAAQITNNGTGVTRLTKTDAGTWILTNPGSTYTGVTTISGGVLGVDKLADGGVASSIGASSAAAANLIIGNGSTLRYTGAGDTTNRLFTLSQGVTFIESSGTGAIVFTDTGPVTLANNNQARTIALGGTNAGNNTLAGSIGNAGSGVTTLAKNDSGTWVLTGNHSYTGSTNINGGLLSIGGGGTTGSIASGVVNNFGTLAFDRSDSLTYAGTIVGTGGLFQNGAGTTILTGANSYSGGTTINAGTLQIGNGGATGSIVGDVVNNGILAFDRNALIFAGVISGSGAVEQRSGVLALTGTNSYAGGTTISGGSTLQITSDANLGDAAGGITFDNGTLQVRAPIVTNRDITLAGAGTLNVDTSAIAGTNLVLAGDITGPGSLTKTGLGQLTLTGDATHTGGTTISQGILRIGNGGTTGSITGDIVNNTSVLFDRSDSYTYGGTMTGSGSLSVDEGILTLTANSSIDSNITAQFGGELRITAGNTVTSGAIASVASGTLTVSGAGSTLVAERLMASTNAGGATVNVENGGTIRTTVAGLAMSPTGAAGPSALNVSGANSLLDLGGGLTAAASNNSAATATITISNGGSVRSTGSNTIGSPIGNNVGPTVTITGTDSNWTSGGTLTMRNGDFSILAGGAASFGSVSMGTVRTANILVSGAGSVFTTTGAMAFGGLNGTGILTLADGGRATAAGGFTLANTAASTGVINIGGAEGQAAAAAGIFDAPTLAFGPGTGRLNFNHTDTNHVFAAAISGNGTINHVAGDTSMTGNSALFSGTTNVLGGTLRVNGTLGSAASLVNVGTGGVLGGAGTIGGSVAITDGRLAPGNSPGTLNILGNLSLASASQLDFEFGQAGTVGGALNDLVNVGGNLTLDGTINVTVPAGGNFGAGIYRVFNYGGALTNNGLDLGTMPGGSNVVVQTSVAGQVNLVNTAGLSLSFWDGDAGPKFNDLVDGGDGTWRLDVAGDNWTNDLGGINAGYADGSLAIFAGAAGTVTVDNGGGAVTTSGMQFASDNYVIDGAPLTLVGPQATIRVGDGTAAGADFTATISADLTGASQLVKTDAGTLVLTGANSYTGGTLISGGVLSVADDSLLGDVSGALTLDGGTLRITGANSPNSRTYILGANGGAIDIANAATSNGVLNAMTGSGGLTKLGDGSLALAADNDYTGGTTILGGTLQIGSNSGTTGSIVGDVVNNGRFVIFRSNAYTYAGSITGTGGVSVTGTGVTTLTGNSNYDGSTLVNGVGGELRIAGGANVTSGGGTIMGRSTLSVDGANSVFSTASIGGNNIPFAGSAIVNVTDGGTLRITADDLDLRTLSASTQINITGASSLADVSGGIRGSTTFNAPFSLTIGAGGTLRTAGASQIGTATSTTNPIAIAITGAGSNWTSTNALLMTAGDFTVDQGGTASFTSATFGSAPQAANLSVSGASSRFATTGDLVIGSGSGTGALTLTDDARVDVGGAFILADNAAATGILNIGGAEGSAAAAAGVFDAPTLNLGSATSRLNFNHTGANYAFVGAISGAGAINQVSGTTRLTGASSAFAGTASVSGGTLLVDGALGSAASFVSVGTGGTLGGTGIIGGNVDIADGNLNPGDLGAVPGALAIGGNLNLAPAANLNFDFGQANVVGGAFNDLIEVGGDLTLDGTLNVAVSPGGSFDPGVYRVINYGGALTDNGLDVDPAYYVQTSVANQVNLVNTTGLTMRFWDGVAGAKNDDLITGGDGLWQASGGNDNWTEFDGSANAPFTDEAFAVFSGLSGTVTVDASLGTVTASGMQFASDGYVIEGDPIVLTGVQSVIRVGDGTLAGAGYTATIDSAIAGAAQLVKSDLGTLVLSGVNSYAGGTAINGGTLRISADANLGDTGGGLAFDGGTLNTTADIISDRAVDLVGTGTLLTDAGTALTMNGAFSGAGSLVKTGAGTLILRGSSGFDGNTTVNGGQLTITDGGSLSNYRGYIGAAAGQTGEVVVSGPGASWTSANHIYVGDSGTGTLTIEDGASVSSVNGNIGTYAGGIGIVAVSGSGSTWTSSDNFLVGVGGEGSLTVDAGANVINTLGSFVVGHDTGGRGSVIASGAGSTITTRRMFVGNYGNGELTIANGAEVSNGTSWIGAVAGSQGTINIGAAAGQGPAAAGVLNTPMLTFGEGDGALVFNHSDTDYLFSAGLESQGAGTHAVQHLAGTTILSGDGSGFAGTTTVSGGTLLVGDQSGAGSLGGAVNVALGGTLGGAGTLGSNVAIADGGALAAGVNGAGTLTINGNLSLAGGSILNYEFGQAGVAGGALNDLVDVGGDLVLDGTIDVTVAAGGNFGPGVYRVFNYGGALTDNGLDLGTMPGGSQVSVQTAVAGQVNLVNSQGVALSFWDGFAGPKNNGAVDGGNGVWRIAGGSNNWTDANGTVNADYAQDSFAIFSAAPGTVTIDNSGGDVLASGMQFASDGYVLTGDALTLTGTQAIVQVGDSSAAGAGYTATIASALTGTAGLVKTDAGRLILTGANSYTGGTAINGGTLQVASDANLGDATGGLSFDGGTLDVTNAFGTNRAVNLVGTGTFLVQGTGLNLRGLVSGAGALVKEGNGTVTLTADNAYTGGTTINAGLLQIGDGGTTGSILGDIVNNGRFAVNRSDTLTLTGTISGSGDVLNTGTGTTILTAANSYTGTTRIVGGTLLINGDQSAATGNTAVAARATLGGTGIIGGNVLLGVGTLAPGAGGAGTLTINGELLMSEFATLAYDFGQTNNPGGALNDLVNIGGDLVLDGTIDVTVPAGGSFDIGLYRVINYGGALTDNGLVLGTMPAGSNMFVQTAIGGQVNLINRGSATLNFWDGAAGPKFDNAVNGGDGVWQNSGGNDNWADVGGAVNAGYDDGAFAIFSGAAGTVTIDNGLGAVSASGMQFATGGYVISGDALALDGAQAVIRVGDGTAPGAAYVATIDAELTGAAELVKTDAGTLVLTGANSYAGGTLVNGGTLQVSGDANLGAAAGGLRLGGGTLQTTTSFTSAREVELLGTGGFRTDAGTTLTLAGALSGAGSFTKSGGGTLALGGSGTFGGATVAGGTLFVNGDYAAATGTTSVLGGATLGGTGTIGGDVALGNGAILAPGAGAPGTLTIGGNLSLSATSQLDFEFGEAGAVGGALNDLVNVGGDLVLDGVLDVGVPAGGAFEVGVYRMFNYGGALTDNGVTLGTLPAGSNAAVQTSIAGQINLVNAAGMTLNFWDGAGGPKNNGAINGGDGVWQNSVGNDSWTGEDGAVNAAYSDGAFAIFGGTGGTVTVDDSLGAVSVAGMQFAADDYVIGGDGIALTDATATIRVGDGSAAGAGFTATIDSVLGGAAQLVKSDAGTLVLGGTNSYTGGTLIAGGTLRIARNANLGAADGDVTLDGGTLETSADITSTRGITVASEGAIATAADTLFTFDGLFSGGGALTKAGAGTLLVTADNSGFGGSTTVADGTLAVQGSLGGAVSVNPAGRLEGGGRVGSIVNAGVVAPGSSIGSLTVAGDYRGAGGTLEIEAELGGDASQADRLIVGGATSGSTRVAVINRGGLGAQTVEGIKIIDIAGASNGNFTLDGDYLFDGEQAVIAGAYGYRLYKNGIATPQDGDWYLRSALLDGPGEPEGPLYQPGVPLYENYGQVLQSLNSLPTLQERVGNRQWARADDGASTGIWGRMESTRARPEARVSTADTDANIDSWKMQIGVDRTLSETGNGTLVAGITGHYGESNAAVRSTFGDGSIEAKSYGAGATLTWYHQGGFYADAQAQFAWFDGQLESSVLGTLVDGNDGTGKAFSLEVGKRAVVGNGLTVTPQIQMSYQDAGFDSFTDPSGARVTSSRGDSLKSRWGISLDHQKSWQTDGTTRRSHLYGLVNLSYEWLDGTAADVSGTAIRNANDRLWGEIALGGSLGLNDRVTLYTQASASSPLRDFGDDYSIKGTAGVRVAF